jgi:D-alanyl-D-alanine carboxypeptidase
MSLVFRILLSHLVLLSMLGQSAWGFGTSDLAAVLEEARIEMKMPGLRGAIRYPDGRVVRAAVGLADKEAEIPLDNAIGMPGGSTGKMFVAALAMLLVEDGTIDLDDPAYKWLGDRYWFPQLPNGNLIRVRHLLSHSAGLDDYPGTVIFNRKMIWRTLRHGSAYFDPEELISFVSSRKGLFAPGEGFSYTDAGYLVLGRLIEAATGRSYYDLLQERILEPLELDSVRPQDTSVLPDIAIGYMGGGRALKKDGRMKFDPRSEWTGGGLVTNPTMLVEFVAALAEGRIVRPESLAQMLDGGWRDPEQPDWHYGFGMFVAADQRAFSHGGLWPGYRTRVMHDFDSGITIAVQTNRDGRIDMAAVVRRIAAAIE